MDYQGLALANEFQIDELFSLHYFEYMNSFYFPGESHPFWEFVCVDKGEVTIGAGDRSFVLTRGQIVFHRPDEFHWVRAGGKAAPNLIVISFSTGSPLMDFFSERILQITEQDRLLLARIISEARLFLEGRLDDPYQKVLIPRKNAPAGSAQIIRTCLEQFLIGLFRRFGNEAGIPSPVQDHQAFVPDKTTTENADDELFSRLTEYLDRRLNGHVTIDRICSDNLIGRSQLQKLFQKRIGAGIIEYFSDMKIDAAKQLIRTEQMNFTQISEKLGYSSIHYFSRQFKKVTGMTPSEYASSIKAMADRDMEQGVKSSRKKGCPHRRQADDRKTK